MLLNRQRLLTAKKLISKFKRIKVQIDPKMYEQFNMTISH